MTDVTKQTYEEVFAEAHKRAVAIGESVGIYDAPLAGFVLDTAHQIIQYEVAKVLCEHLSYVGFGLETTS